MSNEENTKHIMESMERVKRYVIRKSEYLIDTEKWHLMGYLSCLMMNELITREEYEQFTDMIRGICHLNNIEGKGIKNESKMDSCN